MKEKFKELTEKYPNLSSLMVFVKAVWKTGHPKSSINKHFKMLVDKDDYESSEQKTLLKWVYQISAK